MAVLPTHAIAERYRVAQAGTSSRTAARVLVALRRLLQPARLTESFPAYALAASDVVADGRAEAAAQAQAFYLATRAAAGVTSHAPHVDPAPPIEPARLATSLLVTGPVTAKKALARGATIPQAMAAAEVATAGAVYRHTANAGRETIRAAVHRDREAIAWARVTDGRPCWFCAMLASRGAVYESERTATTTEDGDPYHDGCGCYPFPIFSRRDPIPGLGPELQKLWEKTQQEKPRGVKPADAFRAAYEEAYPADGDPAKAIERAQRRGAKSKAPEYDADLLRQAQETDRRAAEAMKAGRAEEAKRLFAEATELRRRAYGKDEAPAADTGQHDAARKRAADFERWSVGRGVDIGRLDADARPDFDPDNVLAAYGDRLVIQQESEVSHLHLSELERFVPVGAHRALRDHFAERPGGGFYIGDEAVPELDDLGSLRGVQPRGWPPGSTWDSVPGAYHPVRRVCACGGGGHGHGSTSLVLHEGGHALDDALGTQDITHGTASESPAFRAAWAQVLEAASANGATLNPYFTPEGNPSGYRSEGFAESFAAWARNRGEAADADKLAMRVGRALTDGVGGPGRWLEVGRPLVEYFDALDLDY